MLHNFLSVHRLAPNFLRRSSLKSGPSSSPLPPAPPVEPAALKIIHVGGIVEYYYMAVPAVRIMEKYPTFLLARPEIFRRPWESLVRPEEILIPGEKFYVVPRRTVRKLQHRIRRLTGKISSNSTPERSSNKIPIGPISRHYVDRFSGKSSDSNSYCSGKSVGYRGDPPAISGIKPTYNSTPSEDLEHAKNMASASARSRQRQRRVRKEVMWTPTLTVISEASSPVRDGGKN